MKKWSSAGFVVIASCLVLSGACKKKAPADNAAKGSGSAEKANPGSAAAGRDVPSAGSGSAPAPKAACVEGAYKDPDGLYCFTMPEGYKTTDTLAEKDDSHIVDPFTSETNNFLTITVWKKGMTWDNMKGTMQQHIEGNKPVEAVESDGGNAFWVKNHLVKSKQTATGYSIKSGDNIIACWSLADDATPLKPADACKTLRAM